MDDPKPNDADEPTLQVVGQPFTPAKMAAMYKELTGREPTPEETADLPAWCERVNVKIAKLRKGQK